MRFKAQVLLRKILFVEIYVNLIVSVFITSSGRVSCSMKRKRCAGCMKLHVWIKILKKVSETCNGLNKQIYEYRRDL